jgi:hypothetical protein
MALALENGRQNDIDSGRQAINSEKADMDCHGGDASNACEMMDTSRGRSTERHGPRPRAQSVDSATELPSKQQLAWQVDRYRTYALEAQARAESLHEELMQFQEALLNNENQPTDDKTAASRYVARLSRENFRLGGELSRLEQYMSEQQDAAATGCRDRSSSCDSERSVASFVSARSSPMSTPRCKGAPLISPGTGNPLNLRRLNLKKVKPDLDDDEDDEQAARERLDTTRSGTSESTEVDSEEEESDDISTYNSKPVNHSSQ